MLRTRNVVLMAGDILVLIVSFLLTLLLGFKFNISSELLLAHIVPFSILYLTWLSILYVFNFYEPSGIKLNAETISRLFFALLTSLLIGLIFFYLVPLFGITPKTNLFLNVILFGGLFALWRRFFSSLARKNLRIRIGFFGMEKNNSLMQQLKNESHWGYDVVFESQYVNNKDLKKLIVDSKPNIIVLGDIEFRDSSVLKNLYESGAEIIDLSEAYETILNKIPTDYVDATWVLHKLQNHINVFEMLIKKTYSILFSIIVSIICIPVWIIVPILIASNSTGPILIRQKRVGKNGKIFTLYKFRSMVAINDDGQAEVDGAVWAKENDARVTKIGRFLRKSHIDELPQMINVLKGDILLVGPRPERPEFVVSLEKEIPYYNLRHIVHPGFTGWAQIKYKYARTESESKEKFEYDLFYIKNGNPFLDIGIILKTIQIIFTH